MNNNSTVIVYGLGYVGLTLSIVLAENGYRVIGYDTDKSKINFLNKSISYLHEKNIDKRLKLIKKNNKIIYLSSLKNKKAKYHIICVGTPIGKNKKPLSDAVNQVMFDLCNQISKGDCVILRSTVPVGFTRNKIVKNIFDKTKYKAGKDYYICFAPERTIEGKALDELTNNPQIISGFSNQCTQEGVKFFNKFSNKIITLENLESAEIAKLIDNSYRDNIFAFSNLISMICDEYKLDAIDILKKCNSDYSRNNIPLPSPGVGGACLTKDPYILISSTKNKNINADLILNSRKVNETTIRYQVDKILKNIKNIKNPSLLVCGIAFKGNPENSDVRFSTTIDIINQLKKRKKDLTIYVYDSVISKKEIKKLGYKYLDLNKINKKLNGIIIANNHNSFKNIEIEEIYKNLREPKLLCDCWGLLKGNNFNFYKDLNYFGVGF